MIETSSDLLWLSSAIFGNLRKMFGKCSENARKCSSGLRNNFEKSSKIFGKQLEIFRKLSKTVSSACLHVYHKKNITHQRKDMNFMFLWQKQYLTSEHSERVRYSSCQSNIKFISSSHPVISSMYCVTYVETIFI